MIPEVDMLVRFNEISPFGNHYEMQEINGLASQEDFSVTGPVQARLSLKRKGETKVEMKGELKASLSRICDRCLAPYDVTVDTALQVLFETVSDQSWHVKELECTFSDLDSIVLDEPVVDIDDVLRQQIYLVLPVKGLCSERCKGLCVRCGANLNFSPCSCDHDDEGSPFAILKQLKNK
jgi:uncharacterized protein